ncbi:MAG TPA: hypothetical protein DD377_04185 [Firmicutes bacterium]|nr:hypothetical protein [Bacillota bacterium]
MKAKNIFVLSSLALLGLTVTTASIKSNNPLETKAGASHIVQFGKSYNSKGISGYTNSWSVNCNGIKYNLENWNNNNNEWDYVKAGSKSSDSVATFSTTATFANPIENIVFTFDTWNTSNVSSTTLYTATDSSFKENLNSKSLSFKQGNNTVEIDNSTSDLFYKLEISIKKTSSNGPIKLSKVIFNEVNQSLLAPTNLSFDNSSKTLTWDAVENADSYELTVMDETTMDDKVYTTTTNSYDFSSFADDTYYVSIVAKDSTGNYSNSVASDTTITIQTSGPKLTSITYEGTPKTQYVGKAFDYEGLTFTPHYDAENPNPEEILGSDINWPDLTENMTSITGTYRGIDITINPIEVKTDVIESIAISGDMTNKNYVTGQESFDSTGLIVTGTYSSGETKDVTSESTFTFEKTPGEVGATTGTSIKVNAEYNGLTASKMINDIMISEAIVDTITSNDLSQSGTGYQQFNDIKKNDAIYSGIAIKNSDYIQLNNKYNAGIYSKKQGGIIKKINVEWSKGTNSLDIYCKNTPYSKGADLYGSKEQQGTKIGSLKSGSNTELDIEGNYHFIGLRSNEGALYIKSITITYVSDTAATLAEYIMESDTNGQCTTKFPVANDIYQMLSEEEKAKFVSSASDETIANAVARYEAWAISLNVTNPYEAYNATSGALISLKQDKNNIVFSCLFGVISIATIVGFCLLKRKKA